MPTTNAVSGRSFSNGHRHKFSGYAIRGWGFNLGCLLWRGCCKFLPLPVTTAHKGAIVPILRRLKTYLRASTSEERLSRSSKLSIHSKIQDEPDRMIDELCAQCHSTPFAFSIVVVILFTTVILLTVMNHWSFCNLCSLRCQELKMTVVNRRYILYSNCSYAQYEIIWRIWATPPVSLFFYHGPIADPLHRKIQRTPQHKIMSTKLVASE